MHTLIIGSGVVGLTAAYALNSRGNAVTVVDRRNGPGLETSHANGALLTPSMSEPWNAPGCWRVLLSSLLRPHSPLLLRVHTLPGMTGWGVKFLRNSALARFRRNTESNVRLAIYSLRAMEEIRTRTGIGYGRAASGTLRVFRGDTKLRKAREAAERLRRHGLLFREMSRDEVIEAEPALRPIRKRICGAIHYAADEVGDAYEFSVALSDYLRRRGVEFRYGSNVSGLNVSGGRVSAANSGGRTLEADNYVIAACSHSAALLGSAGIGIPVQPVKGYSLTLRLPDPRSMLSTPVIDDELHSVVVPLGNSIRVAGTAEFAGYDSSVRQARIDGLRRLLDRTLPEAADCATEESAWCGLRAVSVDGVPIVGSTPVRNLFVSTGHGHLGWTMAAGSGALLADIIHGETPALPAAPYGLARFRGRDEKYGRQ